MFLGEAFQSKKRGNLGISQTMGEGASKNQKSPKFQLGKVQNNDSFSSYEGPYLYLYFIPTFYNELPKDKFCQTYKHIITITGQLT